MSARTQAEILARYQTADDLFGCAGEVLAEVMTTDTLWQIAPNASKGSFQGAPEIPADLLPSAAAGYLDFAVQKILHHRGLSSKRSVIKLREFAWLLGRDDVVQAMDDAKHAQYGAPKVQAFADGMGWPLLNPAENSGDRDALERMSQGLPCRDGCDEGCGQ